MRHARAILLGLAGIAAVVAAWELYKAVGPADGVVLFATEQRGSGIRILPRTHDRAMPHVLDMVTRLFASSSGGDTAPMWQAVASAAGTTLGIAAVGLVVGVVVGSVLALVMQRWRVAEWGVLPWVVVSQTVPLIAFAPVIASIGAQAANAGAPWPQWMSAAIVASYLAFFPVAIGALRGLQSPDTAHVELMHTYAAGYWTTLRMLRLPAAVPYLLPALRLAAANAVIGAIVAEVSIGMQGGLGRMIIALGSQGSSDPATPWSPIFGAVVLGLVAAGSVALLGLVLSRYRRGETPA
jgi:ABC-type nitrate/sulfonate/bicarbonate transport system, permease component